MPDETAILQKCNYKIKCCNFVKKMLHDQNGKLYETN